MNCDGNGQAILSWMLLGNLEDVLPHFGCILKNKKDMDARLGCHRRLVKASTARPKACLELNDRCICHVGPLIGDSQSRLSAAIWRTEHLKSGFIARFEAVHAQNARVHMS
jgi:hypothetical protein